MFDDNRQAIRSLNLFKWNFVPELEGIVLNAINHNIPCL